MLHKCNKCIYFTPDLWWEKIYYYATTFEDTESNWRLNSLSNNWNKSERTVAQTATKTSF
jgi:hypothetical protein